MISRRFGTLVFGLLILLALLAGCDGAFSPKKHLVTYYADNGNIIESWENATSVDPIWSNSRVSFVDGHNKKHNVLGTVVVERFYGSPSPNSQTATVTLYASDGKVIRTWQVYDVDPHWSNDMVRFIDSETGHQFDIFGRIHVTEN